MKRDFIDCFASDTAAKEVRGLDSLSELDMVISKYAAIAVTDTSPEGVSEFVQSYLMNICSGINGLRFKGMKPLQVLEVPGDNSKGSYIGTAMLTVDGANGMIEIPFMVQDGELIPFDVIQVGKDRVPFTRPNLMKITNGMVEQTKNPDPLQATGAEKFKPYLDVEKKPMNARSTNGFLGNILHVQDKYRTGHSTAGDHYVTAEEVLDMVEKVAAMQPAELEKKDNKVDFEKVAEDNGFEETYAEVEDKFNKIDNLPWKQATNLEHGDFIAIPVIKKRDGMTAESYMDNGIVLRNFLAGGDGKTVVINKEGNMTILENGDKLACLKENRETFRTHMVNLSNLKEGSVFTALKGNSALFPARVRRTNSFDISKMIELTHFDNDWNTKNDGRRYITETVYLIDELKNNDSWDSGTEFFTHATDIRTGREVTAPSRSIAIVMLKGFKFDSMPYNDFIKMKAKETGLSVHNLANLYANLKDYDIVCADPDTKVIEIRDVFTGYIRDKEELTRFVSADLGVSVNENTEKTAGSRTEITISGAGQKFNIKIKYSDVSGKAFSEKIKEYLEVEKNEAFSILKKLGFKNNEIGELLYKGYKNKITVFAPNENAAVNAEGGNDTNAVASAIKGGVKTITGNKYATELAHVTATNLLPQIAQTWGLGALAFEDIEGIAKTAGLLADEFERVAVERKSKSMQKIAAEMLLANEVFSKIAKCDGFYDFEKVASFVEDMGMEKDAYELTTLKYNETMNGNYIVHPAYIREAINVMDALKQTLA